MNKPQAGASAGRPLPLDNSIIYENGPVNGTTDARHGLLHQ
jgi:hypothetical protein